MRGDDPRGLRQVSVNHNHRFFSKGDRRLTPPVSFLILGIAFPCRTYYNNSVLLESEAFIIRKTTLWLTRTGILTGLLIVAQTVTAPAGQIVTGSAVNAVLASAALLGGLSCGITVAAVSPFLAFSLGIGPQIFAIVPAIMAGNCIYVLLLALLAKGSLLRRLTALAAGSCAKSLTLYLLVVQLLCRVLPLKPPQIEKFTAMFSFPQLITALCGGAVALVVVPLVRRGLDRK